MIRHLHLPAGRGKSLPKAFIFILKYNASCVTAVITAFDSMAAVLTVITSYKIYHVVMYKTIYGTYTI